MEENRMPTNEELSVQISELKKMMEEATLKLKQASLELINQALESRDRHMDEQSAQIQSTVEIQNETVVVHSPSSDPVSDLLQPVAIPGSTCSFVSRSAPSLQGSQLGWSTWPSEASSLFGALMPTSMSAATKPAAGSSLVLGSSTNMFSKALSRVDATLVLAVDKVSSHPQDSYPSIDKINEYTEVWSLPSCGLKFMLRRCMLGVCKNVPVKFYSFVAIFSSLMEHQNGIRKLGAPLKLTWLAKPPPWPPDAYMDTATSRATYGAMVLEQMDVGNQKVRLILGVSWIQDSDIGDGVTKIDWKYINLESMKIVGFDDHQNGGLLYLSLRMENYERQGALFPHGNGCVTLAFSWDVTKDLPIKRESTVIWKLSFTIIPNYETLDIKSLLKLPGSHVFRMIEEELKVLLTWKVLSGNPRLSIFKLSSQSKGENYEFLNKLKANKTLGIGHSFSSFVWLCGPITGLVVQPCVGIWSDKCTSKYGRRRPFSFAGSLMISLAVITIGFTADIGYLVGDTKKHCSFFKCTHTRAASVFIIGFWMLGLANNTVQGPARAPLADLSGLDQRNSANDIFCSWMAVGNILGFYAGSTGEWHRWFPFLTSGACCEACGNLKAANIPAFVLASFVALAAGIVTVIKLPTLATSSLKSTRFYYG